MGLRVRLRTLELVLWGASLWKLHLLSSAKEALSNLLRRRQTVVA
jgi:hypothetical protein